MELVFSWEDKKWIVSTCFCFILKGNRIFLFLGARPYKCDECGREFRQWGDLKYHHTSLHSGIRQYQCEYCGKSFARKYSLIVHRRVHTGERNYKCDFCGKGFRASSYLLNHRRIHTGIFIWKYWEKKSNRFTWYVTRENTKDRLHFYFQYYYYS